MRRITLFGSAGVVLALLVGNAFSAAAADPAAEGATFTLGTVQRVTGKVQTLADPSSATIAEVRNARGEVALADTSLAQNADPSIRALAAATSNYVDLSWAAVPGATGYIIARDGQPIANTSTTSFRDKSVTPGATIDYIITTAGLGVDQSGRTWGLSAYIPNGNATSLDLAQQAKTVAAATSYSTSAVQWQTFIPDQFISVPSYAPCTYKGSGYKYGGDNRGYGPSAYPYRTKEQATISWTSGAAVSTSKATGVSHAYTSGGTLVATAQAGTSDMSVSKLSGSTTTSVNLRFVMHAGNPFCSVVAGAIDGAMTITVTRSGSWSITSGNFRQMPNHEIYIQNGSTWKTILTRNYASAECLVGAALCHLYNLTGLYGSY